MIYCQVNAQSTLFTLSMCDNQKKMLIRFIMRTSEEATVFWKLVSECLSEFKFCENN